MATITPTWTENQAMGDIAATIADGVQDTHDIDLDANDFDRVIVQVTLTFNGAATDYVDINIYGSADSGTTVDDMPLYNQRIDADAGNAVTLSMVIEGVPWIRVEIDNQSNQSITSVAAEYAGRNWSSA